MLNIYLTNWAIFKNTISMHDMEIIDDNNIKYQIERYNGLKI